MNVKISLMALLKRPKNRPRVFEHEIQESTTVIKILKELGYSVQEINMLQIFLTNKKIKEPKRISLNHVIDDLDELFITIPVGGGI